jgi:hypothetical protein
LIWLDLQVATAVAGGVCAAAAAAAVGILATWYLMLPVLNV